MIGKKVKIKTFVDYSMREEKLLIIVMTKSFVFQSQEIITMNLLIP